MKNMKLTWWTKAKEVIPKCFDALSTIWTSFFRCIANRYINFAAGAWNKEYKFSCYVALHWKCTLITGNIKIESLQTLFLMHIDKNCCLENIIKILIKSPFIRCYFIRIYSLVINKKIIVQEKEVMSHCFFFQSLLPFDQISAFCLPLRSHAMFYFISVVGNNYCFSFSYDL